MALEEAFGALTSDDISSSDGSDLRFLDGGGTISFASGEGSVSSTGGSMKKKVEHLKLCVNMLCNVTKIQFVFYFATIYLLKHTKLT